MTMNRTAVRGESGLLEATSSQDGTAREAPSSDRADDGRRNRDAVVMQRAFEPMNAEKLRRLVSLRANPGVGLVGELADNEQVVPAEAQALLPGFAVAIDARERDVEHRAVGGLVAPDGRLDRKSVG